MKTIKLNSQGAEVRILQELLNLNNIKIAVDGDFGQQTEKAVINFQKCHYDDKGNPLAADGIVGAKTWAALMRYDEKADISGLQNADPYTMAKIELAHPKLREELKNIYKDILDRNIQIRITDTLRTFDEQAELYAKGRTAPGNIVTYAKPGQSYHNYGLAVDFALLLPGGKKVSWDMNLDLNDNQKADWAEVVAVFKHYGWDWGGNWTSFKDYPHFEKTFGYTTRQLLSLHDCLNDKNDYVVI